MPRRAEAKPLERELDRLYGLPLAEFTAARNELSRELKGSDPEAAEHVKGLKKPTRSAGAINRAARRSRRDVKRVLDASEALRGAQERLLRGEGRDAVRKAVEREREAVERLLSAVAEELETDGGAGEAMLERARGTLHAVAGDPDVRAQLDAGRLSEDHTAVGLGGLEPAPGGAPAATARKPSAAKQKSEARRRLKAAEGELEKAQRALQRAESERDDARKRLRSTDAAVERAEAQAEEAANARDEAASALDEI